VANRAGRNQERERLRDVPEAWHFTVIVISMEGRSGGGSKGSAGGKSAAAGETEKDQRIRQLERTLGRKSLEIEILKNVVGE
jgi:hypothetical protein